MFSIFRPSFVLGIFGSYLLLYVSATLCLLHFSSGHKRAESEVAHIHVLSRMGVSATGLFGLV